MVRIGVFWSVVAIAERPEHACTTPCEVRVRGDQAKQFGDRVDQSIWRVLEAPPNKHFILWGIRVFDKPLANANNFYRREDRRALQLSNNFVSLPIRACGEPF